MLFSSIAFLYFFLPVAWGGYQLLGGGRKVWLIVMSIIFYGNFIPVHILLLAASTVVNFALGRVLLTMRSRLMLAAGIIFNITMLAVFKYSDFLMVSLNAAFKSSLPTFGLILPLALSFFTFQKIAYLVDVYRGGAPRYRFVDFVLFVVFFPQLIAGPIVHHRDIMPQIIDLGRRRDVAMDLAVGAAAFAVGLFKKRCIADSLAIYADAVFGAAEAGQSLDLVTAWIGVVAFALQIYFDFSGYSDMALGLGRMFGIRLPVNFLSPYKARSIIDFWRRWHITLSAFLRDYLYIPLGGGRRGEVRRYLNLAIVMLLGGLWHGANWTFVAWGGLHGFYLAINHFYRAPRFKGGLARVPLPAALTLLAVLVAWVFFRAQTFTAAFTVLKAMAGVDGVALPSAAAPLGAYVPSLVEALGISFGGMVHLAVAPPSTLLWFPVGIFTCFALPNVAQWLSRWDLALNYRQPDGDGDGVGFGWQPTFYWGAICAALLAFSVAYQQKSVQFLYFQF